MDIKIARDYEYTPEWNDNKKDVSPIVVKLRYLTPGERDDCYGWEGDKWVPDVKQMFIKAFISIKNLKVSEDDEKAQEIKTAEGILDTPGLDGLFAELSIDILKQNARRDSKN